jgi:peptide/nickel transport system substrate-binding protein
MRTPSSIRFTRALGLLAALLLTAACGRPAPAAPAAAGTFHEAPMLSARVAAGTLPALEARLPSEPLVKETVDQVGPYGGRIRVLATSSGPYNDLQGGVEGANLFRIGADGITTEPNLARGYEVSPDNTTITIHLRKGVKWSDGQPFTSEDIRFMYEDMHFNEKVRTWNFLTQVKSVEVVDDLAIRLKAPEGLGSLVYDIAGWAGGRVNGYMPSHFLKKWHEKYNPDAQKVAVSEGYVSWADAFNNHAWWDPPGDLALPTLRPWIQTTSTDTERRYDRNPYYWAVDAEGNQLPYLDGIDVRVVPEDEYSSQVIRGAADIAYLDTSLADLPLYRAAEARRGFSTTLWPDSRTSELTLDVNLFHPDQALRKVMQDVRFRQALSMAIDRDRLNKEFFAGLGVSAQLSVLPSASYYRPEWSTLYALFDPGTANRLLDEAGLAKKDQDGVRLLGDGRPFPLSIMYSDGSETAALEMIRDGWKAVGLDTSLVYVESRSLDETAKRREFSVIVRSNPECDERTLIRRDYLWDSYGTRPWWIWDAAKRKATREALGTGTPLPEYYRKLVTSADATLEGERPPDYYIEFMENRDKWFRTAPGTPEYRDLAVKVFDVYFKRVFTIGTVGRVPKPLVASNRLVNVPRPGAIVGLPLDQPVIMAFADQFAFKR